MTVTPEEIIEKAIKGVERDGWHQGSYYVQPTPVERGAYDAQTLLCSEAAPACPVGHLSRAAFGHACDLYADSKMRAANRRAYMAAEGLVRAAIGDDPIPTWNDAPERTKEDVVLAFKRAINHEAAPND